MKSSIDNLPSANRRMFWRELGLGLLLCLGSANLCHATSTVFAWGANDSLQSQVPAGLGNVVAVAGGDSHSLALMSDGTVAAWGFNIYGEATVPPNLQGVAAISARATYSMALTTNGTVVVWGNQPSPPPGLTNVKAIAAGWTHSLALKRDGTVVSWGSSTLVPAGLTNVTAIAAGNGNSLALLADGSVVAWGDNSFGKATVPASATNVTAIAAGADHCLALNGDQTVTAWGRNDYDQASVPQGLGTVISISAGELHSVAVLQDETVAAWGDNTYGQTSVAGIGGGFVEVEAGGYHNLGIKTDGSPFIITQPVDQTVGFGSLAIFRVSVIGTAPFTYQWQHEGTNLANAGPNSFLVVQNLSDKSAGSYTVVVRNSRGLATSEAANLNVVAGPPLVDTPPVDQQTFCGSPVEFFLRAGGSTSTNMTYQWAFQGQPIDWATNHFIILTNPVPSMSGLYSVLISNEYGSTTTGAVLTVTTAAPQITSPLSAYGMQGQPFNYQILDNLHVPGFTPADTFGAQYLPAGLSIDTTNGIISGTPAEPGGYFPVIITRSPCSEASEVLLLTIAAATPTITGPELLSGIENGAVSNIITALGAPSSFGAQNLPSGIGLDPVTGIISGTATYGGEFDSTIWASNQWGISTANLHSSFSNMVIQNLTLDNIGYNYSSPYVLDLDFSLYTLSNTNDDGSARGLVVNPNLLSAIGLEDDQPISLTENGTLIASAKSKLIKVYLVLDFTASISSLDNGDTNGNGISDAVDNMVAGAISFVNEQEADTQIGVYEFHREDQPPKKVLGLTQNKALVAQSIGGIWTNYVQGFPASSLCWDAVFAATGDLGSPNPDEQHSIVMISDGRDESSAHTLGSVISLANSNSVRVYSIGFGSELLKTTLQQLSIQTQGKYHTATNAADVALQFAQVSKDEKAHYVLRWATLKRAPNPTAFTPSFHVSYMGLSVTSPPNTIYVDTNNPIIDTNAMPPTTNYNNATNVIIGLFSTVANAGPPAVGVLRVVPEAEVSPTGMTLRSAYAPRYIRQLRLHYRSNWPCTPILQSTGLGEMLEGWSMAQSADGGGGNWLLLSSPDPGNVATSIPFAAFGRLVTFAFQDIINPTSAFSMFQVDNTLYTNTGGQKFVINNTNSFQTVYPVLPYHTPVDWLISNGYANSNSWVQAELLDPDHDGAPNWQEYQANTDPLKRASVFVIRNVAKQPDGHFQVTFSTSTNRTYRVEASYDLNLWEPVQDGIIGINQDVSINDNRLIAHPDTIFYRVVVY